MPPSSLHCIIQLHLCVQAFELVAFFLTSLALLTRLAVEYTYSVDECTGHTQAQCLGFLIAAITICVLCMTLSIVMYKDLRWKRYKSIGAEVATRQMYQQYEFFTAVRKLDLQFAGTCRYHSFWSCSAARLVRSLEAGHQMRPERMAVIWHILVTQRIEPCLQSSTCSPASYFFPR